MKTPENLTRMATRPRRSRPVVALLALLAAAQSFACGSDIPTTSIRWIREPVEIAWLETGERPRLIYTVSVDSRTTHHTVLMLARAGDDVSFLSGTDSDPNGNAPPTPGEELLRSHALFQPRGHRLNDRSVVLVLAEERDGTRQVRRVTWTATPSDANVAPLRGTGSAIAFASAQCGEELCVVTALADDAPGATLVLSRLDAEGNSHGEATAMGSVQGVLRALHLVPVEDELQLILTTCDGCETLDYEDWEEGIYRVDTRVERRTLPPPGAEASPAQLLFEWPALTEPVAAATTADNTALLLVFWRMEDIAAPGCTRRGYCPTARELVAARWAPGMESARLSAPLVRSELAYLAGLVDGGVPPVAMWRVEGADDRYLRNLYLASFGLDTDDGSPVVDATTALGATYTPQILADERSDRPHILPFTFLGGLAAVPADQAGELWLGLTFRDLPPGAPVQCGEDARVGVWTARTTVTGELLQVSTARDSLFNPKTCGGGGCGKSSAAPPTPLFLILLAIGLRRRRRQA